MSIFISNLAFQGLSCGAMRYIPDDIGIEIFCEIGNDYYWDHLLPLLLNNRKIPLSLHGPFQRLDLSDPDADFAAIKDAFIWAFELGKKYGAKDCVCHPYSGHRPCDETVASISVAKETTLKRIIELDRIANIYGIQLLIENMPETDGLLDEKSFINLFSPYKDLRFLIDTGHAHLQHWDMRYVLNELGDRVLAYHINDNFGDFDTHLKVGEGSFNWDEFFSLYKQYTPAANLVLEYNNGPLESILDSVSLVKKYLV